MHVLPQQLPVKFAHRARRRNIQVGQLPACRPQLVVVGLQNALRKLRGKHRLGAVKDDLRLDLAQHPRVVFVEHPDPQPLLLAGDRSLIGASPHHAGRHVFFAHKLPHAGEDIFQQKANTNHGNVRTFIAFHLQQLLRSLFLSFA